MFMGQIRPSDSTQLNERSHIGVISLVIETLLAERLPMYVLFWDQGIIEHVYVESSLLIIFQYQPNQLVRSKVVVACSNEIPLISLLAVLLTEC